MTQKSVLTDKNSLAAAPKKQSGFKRFLRFVFVKNIELKILALFTAVLMWALVVGLGGV